MRISTIAYMNGTGGSARATHAAGMSAFRSPAGLASPTASFPNGWLRQHTDHVVCTQKTGTTTRRPGEASP